MSVFDKLYEKRAFKEAEALKEAIETCEEKIGDIEIKIASSAGNIESYKAKLAVADQHNAVQDIYRINESIKRISDRIKLFKDEQVGWSKLINILSSMMTCVEILQQHGEYREIVKALQYRLLKRKIFTKEMIDKLINKFTTIYIKLKEAQTRTEEQNDKYMDNLYHADTLSANRKHISEAQHSRYKESLEQQLQELRAQREAEKSSIAPAEKSDAENRINDNSNNNFA